MSSILRTAADDLGVQQLLAFGAVCEKRAAALGLTLPAVWEQVIRKHEGSHPQRLTRVTGVRMMLEDLA